MSSCSFCGGLVLKPDTAYGINPSAVCKCPHPHVEKPSDPQPLQTIEPMKVLVACEYSGRVREAFRKLGHNAWSCDVLPADDGSEYHIQDDVLKHLGEGWDLMIAHPPCTHLAASGAKHFAAKIADGRQQQALDFVQALLNAPIQRIALENPVSIISTKIRKPTQIIQPWQFGHEAQKTTCLWLKNLPKLTATNIVGKGQFYISPKGKRLPKWYSDTKDPKKRSETFQGIADAMADQWGRKRLTSIMKG